MIVRMLKSVFLLTFLLSSFLAYSQESETGFLDRSIEVDGKHYPYQVYVPRDYNRSSELPVTLFLHGAGERGSDGLKPTQTGLGEAIRKDPDSWPTIAVFPQVPSGESWLGVNGTMAVATLDATIAEFSIDEERQYLTGLSLGGNGTWYVGYNHRSRFAAMVPICGYIGNRDGLSFVEGENPYNVVAQALSEKPLWIFHGDSDVVIPVEESRKMAEELSSAGANFRYTELPGVNHNSWDDAYANGDMVSWLFEQRLR